MSDAGDGVLSREAMETELREANEQNATLAKQVGELRAQMEKMVIVIAAMLNACGCGDDSAMMIPAEVMADVHGRGAVTLRVGKGENEGDILVAAQFSSPLIRTSRLVMPS